MHKYVERLRERDRESYLNHRSFLHLPIYVKMACVIILKIVAVPRGVTTDNILAFEDLKYNNNENIVYHA